MSSRVVFADHVKFCHPYILVSYSIKEKKKISYHFEINKKIKTTKILLPKQALKLLIFFLQLSRRGIEIQIGEVIFLKKTTYYIYIYIYVRTKFRYSTLGVVH